MNKIYGFECKRLISNKFFIGIAAVIVIYGWQVLKNITIKGVSYTAPFSPWSFGDYLCHILPLLWIGTLFFVSLFHTEEEERRSRLFIAVKMKPQTHGLLRCLAILTVAVLLAFISILPAFVFYAKLFEWYSWGSLIGVAVITLVPGVVFALGSGRVGVFFGRWALYLWMLVPFVLKMFKLPEAFGILNGTLFTERPLQLKILDPAFSLNAGTTLVQILLFIIGIACVLMKRARGLTPLAH